MLFMNALHDKNIGLTVNPDNYRDFFIAFLIILLHFPLYTCQVQRGKCSGWLLDEFNK